MSQPCSNIITSKAPAERHIPFGLKEGRMVRVQEVATGLACGCMCPACGHPLVAKAKDSNFRRPHFAHYRDADCRAGFETSIHKVAKQLIANQLRLFLPEWDGEPEMPNPPMLQDAAGFNHLGRPVKYPTRHMKLVNAALEVARGDYIPDVTATDLEGELLIEIRVTHAVEALKRRRVQADGVRMLEIDLSRVTLNQALDIEFFSQEVLDNPKNRLWLSCPTATEEWRASRDELKAHVHKVNREIEEARARQEVKLAALRTALEVKTQNKAIYREQLRRPLLNELADLAAIVSIAAIAQRVSQLKDRDCDAIAESLGVIESQPLRTLLAYYHPDAWVYGAHPVLWQIGVYQHFIRSREAGFRFNQRDVATWVRDRFGIEKSVYRLFLAQYKARSQARNGGFNKNRISAWYFSAEENAAIPNVYRPVNWLVDKMAACGLLEHCTEGVGWVVVR